MMPILIWILLSIDMIAIAITVWTWIQWGQALRQTREALELCEIYQRSLTECRDAWEEASVLLACRPELMLGPVTTISPLSPNHYQVTATG